jgi:hypothetical protein
MFTVEWTLQEVTACLRHVVTMRGFVCKLGNSQLRRILWWGVTKKMTCRCLRVRHAQSSRALSRGPILCASLANANTTAIGQGFSRYLVHRMQEYNIGFISMGEHVLIFSISCGTSSEIRRLCRELQLGSRLSRVLWSIGNYDWKIQMRS